MNNGKICISVCAETASEMIEKIRRAEDLADLIEVRFDCLDPDEIPPLLASLPLIDKTLIFTFRPSDQGGKRLLTLDERVRFWGGVLSRRQEDFMIDVEFDPRLLLAIDAGEAGLIVSHHEFDQRTENTYLNWVAMTSVTDGVIKIAIQADDIVDAIPVWKLLDRAASANRKIIPIAMGEAGKWTRILGLAHGAFATYGSLHQGDETGSGQFTAKDLIETYRVRELDKDTDVYGVIGDPVTSSLSPYIHNPALVSSGLNAVFIPLMVKDLDAFMLRMVKPKTREVELNFQGFAVTMPHKQAIIKYLDEIDPTASTIGAVNTVSVNENGKLIGYNTDADGFIESLKGQFGDLRNALVAVFGSGGAARACVFALKREGCDVTIFARDGDKAKRLADEFEVHSSPLAGITQTGFDIVVNATPVGMTGAHANESLLNAAQLKGVKFVFDLATSSADTPLITEAKTAGIPAIGGLEMLIAQGAKQFEIWTGQTANAELMRSAALDHIR